jgi:hypothetical protein
MKKRFAKWLLFLMVLAVGVLLNWSGSVMAGPLIQIPTIMIPTVTGTPTGPVLMVKPGQGQDFVHVRSGPGTVFDKIGILFVGQKAVAKGRSPGGEWILVEYQGVPGNVGWVMMSVYVDLTPGDLPIIELPPTPTMLYTKTIDPTLAAQFVVTVQETRLPTFTMPPPLVIPTFQAQANTTPIGLPMGLLIVSLAAIGVLTGLVAVLRGR